MASSTLHRRGLRSIAVAAVAALALAGCGSSSEGKGNDGSNGSSAGAAFPVTIESSLGEATIEDKPERIVTLGQGSAETAIALGTTPVGMEEYVWGADDTGYLPWVHEAVEANGDELPALFTGGESLDLEAIVELDPDVILAPWSGITQEQFDTLSDLAPVVAYPDLAWSTDWDQQIEIIGEALGQSDDAKSLIDEITDQFDEVQKAHPAYADTTFSYIYTTSETLGVFLPSEQRVAMLTQMGLQSDPVVESFEETEGTDSAIIGYENADQLNKSDLIFTFYADEAAKADALANPLYASIPAVDADAVVASTNNSFVTASSIVNPLTVPWVTEEYTAMIDAAIAKISD